MKELQEAARKLLAEGTVQVVIGYEEGPRGVRAAFITKPEQADKLIFDRRCTQNLTTYLNPRRAQVTQLGKPALVVKGCDARSLAGLIREKQLDREKVYILAVRCGGVLEDSEAVAELTPETVSVRCGGCEVREPHLYDQILGELPPAPPVNPKRAEQIAALEKMTPVERRQYWDQQLERCIQCHACREACPMCFCVKCTAEKTQPQWIDTSATLEAARAWQTMRVLHQAGRCVDCLECERACPEHIPLGLLVRYVADRVEERFEYKACDDPTVAAPFGMYRPDDEEEFIR
jgi:ferredoxin